VGRKSHDDKKGSEKCDLLKMEEGATSQGMQVASRNWERKDSSLETPGRSTAW
jgi:hypothetical protein